MPVTDATATAPRSSGARPEADVALFAQGCIAADPHFFAALDLDAAALQARVAALVDEPGSDCFAPHAVFQEGQLAGFLCAYPLKEIFSRQATTLKALLPHCGPDLPAVKQRLAALQRSKAPLAAPDSLYLAKLFVAPWARGRGCGERLMAALETMAKGHRGVTTLALHVRAENGAARRLYERSGFIAVGGSVDQHGYLAMERPL